MFGERLRELRKSKKLTAKQLGEKFNLAESTISGYETGARNPDITQVQAFANYFEVSTDYILGSSDSPYLSAKDEKDIAKRMEKIRKDLIEANASGDGIAYQGDPMSPEAIESLLAALEHAERITTLANKKYAPKKHKKKD